MIKLKRNFLLHVKFTNMEKEKGCQYNCIQSFLKIIAECNWSHSNYFAIQNQRNFN